MNGGSNPGQADGNSDHCGFVCPACNFRLLLSDGVVTPKIIESFKEGHDHIHIVCPECGKESFYNRSDLKLFLSGGRQVAVRHVANPQRE